MATWTADGWAGAGVIWTADGWPSWTADGWVQGSTVAVTSDAGGPVRHRREQYIVKIDGQEFVCRSIAEVYALMAKAKEAAKLFSQKEAEKAAREFDSEIKLPTFTEPKIEANSRDLRPLIAQAKKDIAETYRQALIEHELRMLFEVESRQQDNEDAILLLM